MLSSLRPLSCWFTSCRHTCTHIHLHSTPTSLGLVSLGSCWIILPGSSVTVHPLLSCSVLYLIFLLSAEPGIPLSYPFPIWPTGRACVHMKCLSGLARPYFCYIEIPLMVVSLECCPRSLQCILSACNIHLHSNCFAFVVLLLLLSEAGRPSARRRCFHILVFGKCTFGTEIFINLIP